MDKFIIKFFGINHFNFYGWCVAGLFVIVLSVLLVIASVVSAPDPHLSLMLMLGAIWLLLLGIFTALMSFYSSLLAEKLEQKQELAARRDFAGWQAGTRAAPESTDSFRQRHPQ